LAANVFYSVCPYGTGDLKTGSPTISITSGVATLSVPQTGNIGVGCEIDYDTGNTKAYISAVNSATSFDVVTVIGGTPGNTGGALTVNSIHHVCGSLQDALDQADDADHLDDSDLTSLDVILNIACYTDHDAGAADGIAKLISGMYTTDATRYLKIYTPNSASECVYDASGVGTYQRHNGVYPTTGYRIEHSSLGGDAGLYLASHNYVKIEGISIRLNSNGYDGGYCFRPLGASPGNTLIDSCIFVFNTEESSGGYLIDAASGGHSVTVRNSIGYHIGSPSGTRGWLLRGEGSLIQNTACILTVADAGSARGIWCYSSGYVTATNCYARGYGSKDGYYGTFNAASDYNSSDLSGDAPNLGGSGNNNTVSPWYSGATADAAIFVNAATYDFHLTSDSTLFSGVGDDLSGQFTDDIDGDLRANWDLGPDEYAAEGAGGVTATITGQLYPITSLINANFLIGSAVSGNLSAITSTTEDKVLVDAEIIATLTAISSVINAQTVNDRIAVVDATLSAITSLSEVNVLVSSQLAGELAAITSVFENQALVDAIIAGNLQAIVASIISSAVPYRHVTLSGTLAAITSIITGQTLIGCSVAVAFSPITSTIQITTQVQNIIIASLKAIEAVVEANVFVSNEIVATLAAITARIRARTTVATGVIGFPCIDGGTITILGG